MPLGNLLLDPGFELGFSGWVNETRVSDDVRSGSWACSVEGTTAVQSGQFGSGFVITPARWYTLGGWFKWKSGTSDLAFKVSNPPGAGEGGQFTMNNAAGTVTYNRTGIAVATGYDFSEWTRVSEVFPAGSTNSHDAVQFLIVSGAGGDEWYVDDLFVYGPMPKRREILLALQYALQTNITNLNGHPVPVQDVVLGYRSPQDVASWPSIALIYGDEVRGVRAMHRKQCTLTVHAVIYAGGNEDLAQPGDYQCDQLTKSIETIIEAQTGGMWLALGYIEEVRCVKLSPFEVPGEVARGRRVWAVDIEIVYHYDRLDP